MTYLAIANFVLIIVMHATIYVALFLYLRGIFRQEWKTPATPFTPKTAVILTLRGADPSLNRCIGGLLKQDYPNYTIFMAIDHASDPALQTVHSIIEKQQPKNVEIVVVDEHLPTCTLKCNSLYYVTKNLDPSYEVVAILDADTNPHPSWLRDLVEPLSDSRFSVASGQRWFMPDKDNFGSLIRFLWNAVAIVLSYHFRIAWGGSLALKRSLFVEGKLLDDWKKAFTDDASIMSALAASGSRSTFVPSLFMVNRETCTIPWFHRWVQRQLLCAKLHHPTWFAIVGHAVLIMVPIFVAIFLLIYGFINGNNAVLAWTVAALVVYCIAAYAALPIMDQGVRRKLRERNEPLTPWTWRRALQMLIAIPLTQVVYCSSLFWLQFLKKVEWRGVWYEIGKDKTVRLIEYIPYAEVIGDPSSPTDGTTSL